MIMRGSWVTDDEVKDLIARASNHNYLPQYPLGTGSYGRVYCAYGRKERRYVAIKFVPILNDIVKERTIGEVKAPSRIRKGRVNANIVSTLAAFVAPMSVVLPMEHEPFAVCIVQELMSHTLGSMLTKGTKFSPLQSSSLLYQILAGLDGIHSANMIHRDLKPDNIMIDWRGRAKIGDFGFTREMPTSEPMTPYVVTRYYRAPDVQIAAGKYTQAADVWSVGCIFAELLRPGTILFRGYSRENMFVQYCRVLGADEVVKIMGRNIETAEWRASMPVGARPTLKMRLRGCSSFALDLAERMLQCDPAARIDAATALWHPLFPEHWRDCLAIGSAAPYTPHQRLADTQEVQGSED